MWADDPSSGRTDALRAAGGAHSSRRTPFSRPFDPDRNDVSAFESFGAASGRDNSIISAINDRVIRGRADGSEEADPNFNPYGYLSDNYEDSDLFDVYEYILDGDLDNARSPQEVEGIIADIREERARSEAASANPVAGLLGSIVGAIADPTSYVPVGGAASKLGRTGRALLQGSASAAASEVALQGSQRTRTLEESIMNIGVSGAIGGGVGAFAAATARGQTLNPNNLNNPLRRENLYSHPMVIRGEDGTLDEILPEELTVIQRDTDDLSAARTSGRQDAFSPSESQIANRWTPQSKAGKVAKSAGDFFMTRTPLGRGMRSSSHEARMMTLALADPGGTMTRGNLAGKAGPQAAENIKRNYMINAEQVMSSLQRSVRDLQMRVDKRATDQEVFRLTQRLLYKMEDQELSRQLTDKYGEKGFEEFRKAAEQNAQEIHRLNREFEMKLIDEGLLRDDAKVSQLESELDRLREEVEQLKQSDASKAEIDRARTIRDDVQEDLTAENRKAAPLGDEYGHAQLWNRDVLRENPEEAKAFLRDALFDSPDVDWLMDSYNLTPDQFRALRQEDRARYDQILDDWAGDAWYHRVDLAEKELAAAQRKEKQSLLDLNDAMRNLGVLKRKEGQLTLSEARKKRDALNAEWEAAKQSKARREADLRAFQRGLGASARMAKRPEISLQPRRQVQQTGKEIGETNTLQAQVARETKRMESLAARRDRMDAALQAVEARKAQVTQAREALNDTIKLIKDTHKGDARTAKQAKKLLRKNTKATPLDKMIDEVYANLTQMGRVNPGIMDKIAMESDNTTGRVKERVISLNGEQRMAGIQQGFLRDDLPKILFQQYDQTSAELALREALDYGPNRRWSSWDERLKAIEEDYDDMISQAETRETKDRLIAERKQLLGEGDKPGDFHIMRDRLRGQTVTDDGFHGWANWLSAKVRGLQFARFGGGFLISSQTDLASVALRTGGLGKALSQHGRSAAKSAYHLSKRHSTPRNEMEAYIASHELGMGAVAHAARFDADDLVNGPYGGRGLGSGKTRRVTGAIDKGYEVVSEKVTIFSGLPAWNRYWKIVSGHMMATRVRDSVGRFDKLSEIERADLASVGIGKAEAGRMAKQIEKHGNTDADGRFDPGLERWDNDEDVRTFLMAIQRDMDRAINTPGVGDTPRLMSTWAGKTWLQFQTFAFTFINRFVYPAIQRASMGDKNAITSIGIALMAATNVMVMKDLMRGENPAERFKPENMPSTAYEIVDRSGFLGWMSPYVNAGMTLSPIGGASRYARNNVVTSLLGVNSNLPREISMALSAAADADPDAIQKTLVLMPFSSQLRLFSQFFE